MRIECEILKIVGIEIRFPQMAPLFHCRTKNGEDGVNYGGAKFPKHYHDVTPRIESRDHDVS